MGAIQEFDAEAVIWLGPKGAKRKHVMRARIVYGDRTPDPSQFVVDVCGVKLLCAKDGKVLTAGFDPRCRVTKITG